MDISTIGVSADALAVYRCTLKRPGCGSDVIRRRLGLDQKTLESAIETLGRLALLEVRDGHRLSATDPRAGLERLIEQRVEKLNMEIRQVLAARDVIALLEEDQRHGESLESAQLDIERVSGLLQVRRRIDDLAFFSHKETLCLHPGRPLSASAIQVGRVLDGRSLRRGTMIKSIYHPEALGDALMVDYLCDIRRLGGQVRITEAQMDRMIVFDRDVAVVPVNPRDSAQGALLVREEGLVSQLVTYFDGLWEDAADFEEFIKPSAAEAPCSALSPFERRVLDALAMFDKDEIAARELGVSLRTYRRYVAELMARLGAVNRFQAALRAKEEGWI
ncbi:hypothetical protein GCM10023196_019740 [Actinoallomurus vinaceus]|uniref:HTH luxR-type domain-containing protein n=1 Tax=Actinoallomurus vinaceus TaxID=1080074 RepID=A0ABP8U5S1_9ACTN